MSILSNLPASFVGAIHSGPVSTESARGDVDSFLASAPRFSHRPPWCPSIIRLAIPVSGGTGSTNTSRPVPSPTLATVATAPKWDRPRKSAASPTAKPPVDLTSSPSSAGRSCMRGDGDAFDAMTSCDGRSVSVLPNRFWSDPSGWRTSPSHARTWSATEVWPTSTPLATMRSCAARCTSEPHSLLECGVRTPRPAIFSDLSDTATTMASFRYGQSM